MDTKTLGLIYEAALDPSRWIDAIAGVASTCNAQGGQILLWDEAGGTPIFSQQIGGATDPAIADPMYARYYAAIDPRRAYAMGLAAGEWMACHHICDDRFVARSEFYQDYAIPVLGARYMCGTRLADKAGTHAMLAIARSPDARSRPFDHATLAGLLELTPHLARAAQLHLKIARLSGDLSQRESALNRLAIPMFMADEDGWVLSMNRSAEALAASPSAHLSVTLGRLSVVDEDDKPKLESALRQAVLGSLGTSLLLGSGSAAPVLCTVIPLSERSAHLGGMTRPVAMVLISDRTIEGPFEQKLLQDVFALTPAEARLALALATGASVAEYAQGHRLSVHTVRVQLQAVFLKLGVNRQGAVVAMLQRLLPPVRGLGADA